MEYLDFLTTFFSGEKKLEAVLWRMRKASPRHISWRSTLTIFSCFLCLFVFQLRYFPNENYATSFSFAHSNQLYNICCIFFYRNAKFLNTKTWGFCAYFRVKLQRLYPNAGKMLFLNWNSFRFLKINTPGCPCKALVKYLLST